MAAIKRNRVLVAGLFHETHTFVDETTSLEDFALACGEEILACQGDASPMGGVLEAAQRFGWEVIPAVDMRASPGGMVEDAAVEFWWGEFETVAREALRAGLDAIYLVLHGAMVAPSFDDVEGELLGRIRALAGAASLPVYGVFDLHANFTGSMAKHSDCLVAYRENPHTDGRAMAVLAAELLHSSLVLECGSKQYWRHAGVMWPPTGTGTASAPMRELEVLARRIEHEHPDILTVNVIAGFSFADTPDSGVSFCVATRGDARTAQEALDQLCNLAWELREEGNAVDNSLEEVMREVEAKLMEGPQGPVVVVEPADNIGGGAPGDGTGLLRAFVRHQFPRAAICLNDPLAVERLKSCEVGAELTLDLGGKGSRLDEGPLALSVTLVSRSSGSFALEDRQSHLASMSGDTFEMGPTALVRHEGLFILLTSHKTPPFDLGQWRSQGVEPEKLAVIGVKAAVAHRRAYDKIASKMFWVDTPGPCRSDLSKLPFQKVRRPVFPLAG